MPAALPRLHHPTVHKDMTCSPCLLVCLGSVCNGELTNALTVVGCFCQLLQNWFHKMCVWLKDGFTLPNQQVAVQCTCRCLPWLALAALLEKIGLFQLLWLFRSVQSIKQNSLKPMPQTVTRISSSILAILRMKSGIYRKSHHPIPSLFFIKGVLSNKNCNPMQLFHTAVSSTLCTLL